MKYSPNTILSKEPKLEDEVVNKEVIFEIIENSYEDAYVPEVTLHDDMSFLKVNVFEDVVVSEFFRS